MAMLYDLHVVKRDLAKLVDAALAGEVVIIERDSKPVVRLEAIPQARFKFGILAGKVGIPPDFIEPTPEDQLYAWEGS
jgi:antitoxin (DNA-binding transcriptional repressor) of toxin-antitoxin stability system